MKRTLVLFVTLIALAASGAFADTAQAKPTVAVLGLEVVDGGTGIDAATTKFAEAMSEALRQSALTGAGPFVPATGSGPKDLIEMKLLSGCESEAPACMASIGDELQAQRLLYGKVEKRADGFQVSLKLLHVGKKSMVRTASELVPNSEATGPLLAGWSKKLYARLTGATNVGALIVRANVDRGTVYLDQNVKGSIVDGTVRIDGLAAGGYVMMVEAECFLRTEKSIAIEADKETTLFVELDRNRLANCDKGGGVEVAPQPPSPDAGPLGDVRVSPQTGSIVTGDVSAEDRPGGTSRALFWTSTAVAALGAGTWIYGYSQIKANEGDCPVGSDSDSDDPECEAGFRGRTFTQIGIPVTVAAGVAAGYFFYRGYISSSRSGTAVAANRRGRTILVAPTVSSAQVGGVVQIEF